ncbi:MAG TPA: MOSC N-terminal beta barrel domain-containing protein [Rhodoglobus sp.]|nr:MOSC N-terminal beta barrel domain-containing protein [Rhodoglobus sp.]
MRIAEIWRYPVKSLQGERLDAAHIGEQGVEGDRRWALFDVRTGLGLTARRHPRLLWASASLASGSLVITTPDGTTDATSGALSDWLGWPVELRAVDDPRPRRYETAVDPETERQWEAFDGARGSFRDSEESVLSLISTGSLGEWDARRFRPNIVLDGAGEEDLVGTRVTLGGAVLEVRKRLGRCVLVTRPQPGGIEKDLGVLRQVHRMHGGSIAIGAGIASTGAVRVGDALVAAEPVPAW